MTKAFKGIFFDMGGTLFFPDPLRISQALLKFLPGPFSSADCMKAIHHATAEMDEQIVKGQRLDDRWWEVYFSALLRNGGQPWQTTNPAVREYMNWLFKDHQKNNLWTFEAEGAEATLQTLQAEGYYLAVISNSDGRVQAQLDASGFSKYFHFALDSHLVKCEKPDRKIFDMALKKSGLSPESVLYVGDFVNIDYVGAVHVGMKAVIIDPLNLRSTKGAPTIQGLPKLPKWLHQQS